MTKDGELKPAFFKDARQKGLSCDLARFSTARASRTGRGLRPKFSGLIEFSADAIRKATRELTKSEPAHDPTKDPVRNYSHVNIMPGSLTNDEREKMVSAAKVRIAPTQLRLVPERPPYIITLPKTDLPK